MNGPARIASWEYKNSYLYLIIRQAPEHGPRAHLLCCGIDLMRFDPLCRGTHGICSNPAYRGLQLMRAGISAFAPGKGAVPKKFTDYRACMLVSPRGEGWYRDTMLLENVSPRAAREILEYGVMELVRKVLSVCAPDEPLLRKLPDPRALEAYIESLARKRRGKE